MIVKMVVIILLILSAQTSAHIQKMLPNTSHELITDCAIVISALQLKPCLADAQQNSSNALWCCQSKDATQTKRARIYELLHNAAHNAACKDNSFHLKSELNISKNHIGFTLYKDPYIFFKNEQELLEAYIRVMQYTQWDWHTATRLEKKTVLLPVSKHKHIILIKDNAYQGESAIINYILEQNDLKKYAHASSLFVSTTAQGSSGLKCYQDKINLITTHRKLFAVVSCLGLVIKFNIKS